jgi:hypothetical protein
MSGNDLIFRYELEEKENLISTRLHYEYLAMTFAEHPTGTPKRAHADGPNREK